MWVEKSEALLIDAKKHLKKWVEENNCICNDLLSVEMAGFQTSPV